LANTDTSHDGLGFSLAELQEFDPGLLLTGDGGVDGFVLALALAYNDLKSVHWMNFMLERNKPTPVDAVTPVSGQWNGMRVQAARWEMALAHEILHAIAHAKENGVLAKSEIRKAVRLMPSFQQQRWKQLIDVSSGKRPASGVLRGYLRDLRNDGVFHYAYSERLVSAYRAFFQTDAKVAYNTRAYLSIGPTMNQTRFYFADAAAQRMYCGESDLETLFEEATELINELHHTIAGFVFAYLKHRKGHRS
jgi:hypothetical protein